MALTDPSVGPTPPTPSLSAIGVRPNSQPFKVGTGRGGQDPVGAAQVRRMASGVAGGLRLGGGDEASAAEEGAWCD
jgi:hypothetical protein